MMTIQPPAAATTIAKPGATSERSRSAAAPVLPGGFAAMLRDAGEAPPRKPEKTSEGAADAPNLAASSVAGPPAVMVVEAAVLAAPGPTRADAAADMGAKPAMRGPHGGRASRPLAEMAEEASALPAPGLTPDDFDAGDLALSTRRPKSESPSTEMRRARIESAQSARDLPPARETPLRIADDSAPRLVVAGDEAGAAPSAEPAGWSAALDAAPRRPQGAANPAAPPGRSATSAPVVTTPVVAQALRLDIAAPGLGAVSLGLRLRAAALDLRLRVDDAQGAAAIERDAPLLIERLREAGYAVESVVIERRDGATTADSAPRRDLAGDGARQDGRRRARNETGGDNAGKDSDRRDGVYL